MSTKAVNQQQRRTPLSLTGGVSKSNQNQNSGKSSESNGSSNNGASAKNDNKLSASQKVEPATNNVDTKESTPKDVKKPQNSTDKRQSQQQNANNTETAKNTEKVDEKKTQNGAGKTATNGGNGGAKEKQQNGSEKQENGNGNGSANASSARSSSNTNSNSNTAAKSTTKSNEKSASASNTSNVKEETKAQEQKPAAKGTRSNEKSTTAATAAKEDVKAEEQKIALTANEKPEKEAEKEKDKKKESAPEKVVEKETRSRRNDTAAAAETEKKPSEKAELPATRSSAAQPKARGTPTKGVEKSASGASTPTKGVAAEKTSATQRTRSVTTVIDDVEMDMLPLKYSPEKPEKNTGTASAVAAPATIQPPAATSTPGKPLLTTNTQQKTKSTQNTGAAAKSEIPLNIQNTDSPLDRNSAPRTFTQIGGRRSIRPLNEYTPSKFQSNLQYRESYRRINTELDVSSTTNTSMNVTVGSEVPNNSSFSFFGGGRKRDRTPPPQQQSSMELHNDADYSPPKRARLDMQMFFSVVASPLTLLRSRFSKTSIQSSTPVKLSSKLTADDDEAEVQNVSGISIEEEMIENTESVEKTATEDVTVGKKVDDDTTTPKQLDSPMKVDEKSGMEKGTEEMLNAAEKKIGSEPTNVYEVAAGIADTSVTSAKNRRCNVM